MSAPDLLKALELCRPHIEALSVSDDDPAIKRLLKYVDAAISNSPVDAVPVASDAGLTPMRVEGKHSFYSVSYTRIAQDYIGRRGIKMPNAAEVWVIGGDSEERAAQIVAAMNAHPVPAKNDGGAA